MLDYQLQIFKFNRDVRKLTQTSDSTLVELEGLSNCQLEISEFSRVVHKLAQTSGSTLVTLESLSDCQLQILKFRRGEGKLAQTSGCKHAARFSLLCEGKREKQRISSRQHARRRAQNHQLYAALLVI